MLDNGLIDDNSWQYSAEIKQTEDAADGTALSATDEAQYWTVNGDRKKTIWPEYRLGALVKLKSVTPKELPEGQDATITLERTFANPLFPYTVQVRTWEPNQRMADGSNPTDQVHNVTFPAVPMTDLFVDHVTQTQTLTVATWDDSVYEPQDTLKAGLLVPSTLSDRLLLISTKKAKILDDDRPTITLSVDDTSITEGDTATFTLTRGNNTADELIVGVSVDDPGGFLEGNYASDAVEMPSSVVFAPGEATKQITITPPDDWRDILDNAITFTVAAEPHYDIVGSASLTVQVADNDVAPQVSIAFNHAEVDEGTDLVLQIRRIGENKNPLEIPITAGPVGRPGVPRVRHGRGHVPFDLQVPPARRQLQGPGPPLRGDAPPSAGRVLDAGKHRHRHRRHIGQRPVRRERRSLQEQHRRGEPSRLPDLPQRAHRGAPPGEGEPLGERQCRVRLDPGKPGPHHSRRDFVHHPGLHYPSQRRLRRGRGVHCRAAGRLRLRD